MTVACSGSDGVIEDDGGSNKIEAPNFTAQRSYTNSVVLNWEDLSGATKYEIRYGNKEDMSGAGMMPTNETSAKIANLEKGNSYFFQVRTFSKSDWSEWSKVKKVNTASFDASVTTYNALSKGSDPNVEPEFAWDNRKEALKEKILQESNNADIIAFQESRGS